MLGGFLLCMTIIGFGSSPHLRESALFFFFKLDLQ
jgi:hypothetical protein